MTTYTTSELHTKVEKALREFFCKDCGLLHVDANERSITNKLAEYLQRQFGALKVDGEYNRLGDQVKRDADDEPIIPDIVVHKRRCNCSNELVIEVKKSNATGASRDEDRGRLCDFTKPKPEGKYGYKLGLFLEFGVRDQSGLKRAECYQGGELQTCCCCKRLKKVFCPSAIKARMNDTVESCVFED